MWDLVKLEQIVRAKATEAGDQKVLDLSSSELREILVQCIKDCVRLQHHRNQKGES